MTISRGDSTVTYPPNWRSTLEVIALTTSRVVYVPPMSGVRTFFVEMVSTMALRRIADFSCKPVAKEEAKATRLDFLVEKEVPT